MYLHQQIVTVGPKKSLVQAHHKWAWRNDDILATQQLTMIRKLWAENLKSFLNKSYQKSWAEVLAPIINDFECDYS